MKSLTLAAVLALMTLPAFAQDRAELAQEYVNMPQVQDMITSMFSAETMGAQIAASLPPNVTLTQTQQTRIGAVMSEAMNELRPRLETLMINGSAEVFSAPELRALIDFYGSEHGAAIMTKMSPFMTRTMGALAPEMQALQAKIGPEIVKIMQEKE